MKTNLHRFALPSIAVGFLIGCSTAPTVTETTPLPYDGVAAGRFDPTYPGLDGEKGQKRDLTFARNLEAPPQPPEPVALAPTPLPTPSEPVAVGAPAQPEMLRRSDSVALNYTGTITDIDHANREMTLQNQEGKHETFVVDKEVQRFNEAKVGDKVSMDYHLGYDAEVRTPTPEEERNPLVVVETSRRAGSDAAPGAYDTRRIRAVVTIEGLDRAAQTLTVKGPRGKYFVAKVADPSRLEKVKIGDTILMTFTESTAISLKPAN